MPVVEREQASVEAELSELARGLASLALALCEFPAARDQMARGFMELSALAKRCGNRRVSMTAKALSAILDRLDRGFEDDASFIIDTVINFLESLSSRTDWAAVEAI